ncbi:MAG: aromatic amino acid transport family protein, partial [Candidatus Magasanikbacteria bacterium]
MSKQPIEEKLISSHNGIFTKHNSVWDGIALMMCGTIGAGILGLPYVISKVGVILGVFLIVFLGVIMIGLNMLIGDVVSASNEKF